MRIVPCAPSSSTLYPSTNPSSFRIVTMATFILEAGTSTCLCLACCALRMRVRRSAIGSVMLIVLPPAPSLRSYQLALVTPGSAPSKARFRKQIRQSWNLRRYPRDRPQRLQRLFTRTENFGLRTVLATHAVVATLLILPLVLPERHAERGQERPGLLVGTGRRHDADVHPLDLLDLRVVDLGEDQLVPHPERVIAPAVERPRGDPAEVADAGERQVHEAVEELVHALAAQGDAAPDRHPLAELEVRDRLPGAGHRRLLARDPRQLVHGRVHDLAVLDGVPDPHVHHDLRDPGHGHGRGVAELLDQARHDLGLVRLRQPRHRLLQRPRGTGAPAPGPARPLLVQLHP